MPRVIHEDFTENEVLEETENKDEKLYTQKDIDELKDENLRVYADFQNIKKRLEKEKLNSIKFANEKFALDLLDVLDTLYIAESYIEAANDKLGITNTIKKLEDIFKKYNVSETLYDAFDAELHEAIQSIDSDKESGSIVEIHRKGYKIHDKILRPAMVTLSK